MHSAILSNLTKNCAVKAPKTHNSSDVASDVVNLTRNMFYTLDMSARRDAICWQGVSECITGMSPSRLIESQTAVQRGQGGCRRTRPWRWWRSYARASPSSRRSSHDASRSAHDKRTSQLMSKYPMLRMTARDNAILTNTLNESEFIHTEHSCASLSVYNFNPSTPVLKPHASPVLPR